MPPSNYLDTTKFGPKDDEAVAAPVRANSLFPTLMPAVDFKGADAGVVWTDFSPRLGVPTI